MTQGPIIEQFEEKIARFVGSKFAVAFNSRTSALHGAMFASGLQPGEEDIPSPITFVATPHSALYLEARPIFVDIDIRTYCINPDLIKKSNHGQGEKP